MERRSESRLSVELPGTFETPGQEQRGMFYSQISSRGCRMAGHDLLLEAGDAVELHLGAIGPIDGKVRWVLANAVGVEFDVALDAAIVSYFAAFINDVA